MNEEEKQDYLEKYKKAKEKGVPFFPNIVFKDTLVILLLFLLLLALAYFIGAPLEEQANPADTNYTPRPEWYFLFLFQLLKYFPGQLEVIGVVVIPTLVIILLFLLPFLDRSAKRHFLSRPVISIITGIMVIGVIFLTVQSMVEAPPPAEAAVGDEIAALYTQNCAGCHGPTIDVPTTTNLHEIIAEGGHFEMPAWSADLTTDEIDALAGFILSPGGSELFNQECIECHEAAELVASDPVELKNSLELGPGYPGHAEVDIPDWTESLSREQRITLLNFLIAPDGRRLFVTNCSSCHGRAVGFSGEAEEVAQIISDGGLHLEMPPWQEKLDPADIDLLARYVMDPQSEPEAAGAFELLCSRCHGERIPASDDFAQAQEIIATGGSHETMPVWGDVLTSEQLDALVAYTLESASGAPLVAGQDLYSENCADCHGGLGEGGHNPARPDDIIAPISTAEYLRTRDDFTLRNVIAQGQPNFGMSPFSSAFGGPLDDDEIEALVAFIRSWQHDPPVELPPEVSAETLALSGFEIYSEICAQCHGPTGAGDIGPSLRDANFRTTSSNQDIYDTIGAGHDATEMIAWGSILTAEQINQLVRFIDQLPIEEPTPEPVVEEPVAEEEEEVAAEPEPTPESPEVSFSADISPILEFRCIDCHGTDGGYDVSTYDLVINSGDHGPAVIPGDAENSLLAQKLLGTHEEGDLMPPPPLRALQEDLIQLILDWIDAGAPDN